MSATATMVEVDPFRLPCPSYPAAERLLLGVLLREPKLFERGEIHADLFDLGQWRTCFGLMRELFATGSPIDIVTVANAWRAATIPDPDLLAVDLREEAESYVWQGIVPALSETAERRRWWCEAQRLIECSTAPGPLNRTGVATVCEALAEDVATHTAHGPVSAAVGMAQYLETVHERQTHGRASGWRVLDDILGGFRPGELSILAARTSVGKSACALQLAAHLARQGAHVLYCSPEMSALQLHERLLAAATGLATEIVREGAWKAQERAELTEAVVRVPPTLSIWDAVEVTTADVAIMARQAHGRHGLDVLVVDHLGYLSDQPERYENRTLILGRMMKKLKALTRTLHLHALVLHQLNRQSEDAGTMRRPSLSDLRDSGNIEETADNVLLLHRATRLDTDTELIVAKNRGGPLGDVPLKFFPSTTTFQPRWRSEMGGA